MDNILLLYKINFNTSKDFPLLNRITSASDLMSQFIGDHYKLIEANLLLDGINSALTNQTSYEAATQSLQIAIIDSSWTKIYEDIDAYELNNSITPDFELSTRHFQIIVMAWRDFLNNSPLKLGE